MKPRWRWWLWNAGLWLHRYGWCRWEWIASLGGWLMGAAALPEWFGDDLVLSEGEEPPF